MKRKKPQATKIVKGNKQSVSGKVLPSFQMPDVNWRLLTLSMLIIAPVLLVVLLRSWINNPENLRIKSVEVVGDLQNLDKSTLQPIIEPFAETNLYLLDKKALEEEIEFNPWVYSASLTNVWPDRLVVKIHEQKPIAFWGDDGMVNEFGEVIDVDLPARRGKIPTLYSPFDKGREMVQSYLKLRQWLKDFPVDIVEFKEDMRGSWQLKLANGLKVKIGRQQQERRLRRFVAGYSNKLVGEVEKIDTVDLRYTNGFAVKWNKGS